ncbi:unnamed protein product [Meloidogyne enterolobii]|uniref:Uncharacterized protein n=1 Tax=Meloidogyne enterolobii TaxID=390850 RepID=A0ACB1A546_MELEN
MICKGIVLSKLDKREEAGRAFSAAAQLDHDLLGGTSVWKHWGDFLTSIFMSNINENSAQITGIQAIACTLEHAKISPSPLKARLSIAKFLWLIKILTSFGGSEKILVSLNELLEKYVDNETINPSNWLFWLNALLMEAQQRPSPAILNILKCIGKAFPQKMFYDLRIVLGSKNVTEYLQKYRLSLQNTKNNGNNNHNASPSTSSSSINITTTTMENTENQQQQLASILFCICENNFIEIDALNKIMLDFENFPISPLEELLNEFRQILSSCHFEQFTKLADLTSTIIDFKTLQKLCSCITNYFNFASAFTEQDEEKKICKILQDNFVYLKNYYQKDYTQQHQQKQISLFSVASALRKSILKISDYLKNNMGSRRLIDHAKYLAKFKSSLALIDVFSAGFDVGGYRASTTTTTSSNCNAQIASFLPIFDQFIHNESTICRVIKLRSLNGKIYTFQLENVCGGYDSTKIHILQLFCLLNVEFSKSRHTAQRFIQFCIPQIIHIGSNVRLIECPQISITKMTNSSSSDNFVIFGDILNEMLQEEKSLLTSSNIVEYYYGRLAEQRYSHKNLHELFNNISNGGGGTDLLMDSSSNNNLIIVKRDLLSKWMYSRYTEAESLWNARKKLSIHFALLGLCEYAFFLSSMSPDGLILNISTAQLFFLDYKFDLTKKVCDTLAGKVRFIELDANRPVPFRLTCNISHFLDASIDGHLAGALIAIARSFNTKTLEIWLRPILWDVFSKAAEEDPKMNIVNPVKRAVDTVLTRIKDDLINI